MHSVNDCYIVDLPKVHNSQGNITVLENSNQIPFEVRRLYYLYDIPMGTERGGHGHFELEQFIVAASGSFSFILKDGSEEKEFFLNDPSKALYIKAGIWREILNFSSGAICLVLASLKYDESDYIRDYNDFLRFKNLEDKV